MREEYILQDEDLPLKYQAMIKSKNKDSQNKSLREQAMCEMVNKYPSVFCGSRWDKWRIKQNEENNDTKEKNYDDIPF